MDADSVHGFLLSSFWLALANRSPGRRVGRKESEERSSCPWVHHTKVSVSHVKVTAPLKAAPTHETLVLIPGPSGYAPGQAAATCACPLAQWLVNHDHHYLRLPPLASAL